MGNIKKTVMLRYFYSIKLFLLGKYIVKILVKFRINYVTFTFIILVSNEYVFVH